MASAFGHAVAALAIGTAFTPPQRTDAVTSRAAGSVMRMEIPRWWLLGVVAAVIPDIDVVGFSLGVNYGDPLGHRGFTHSLLFAALLATALTFLAFPRDKWKASRPALWAWFFLATASHPLLDAMTNEGLGVAFFSPFDMTRYFLPWTPIQVSPIGVGAFFSADGLAVLRSEFVWIVLPSIAFAGAMLLLKRGRGAQPASA
jgi:inner membrane protein